MQVAGQMTGEKVLSFSREKMERYLQKSSKRHATQTEKKKKSLKSA